MIRQSALSSGSTSIVLSPIPIYNPFFPLYATNPPVIPCQSRLHLSKRHHHPLLLHPRVQIIMAGASSPKLRWTRVQRQEVVPSPPYTSLIKHIHAHTQHTYTHTHTHSLTHTHLHTLHVSCKLMPSVIIELLSPLVC